MKIPKSEITNLRRFSTIAAVYYITVEDRRTLMHSAFSGITPGSLDHPILRRSPSFILVVRDGKYFLLCWPSSPWWFCLQYITKVPRKQHNPPKSTFSASRKNLKEKKKNPEGLYGPKLFRADVKVTRLTRPTVSK